MRWSFFAFELGLPVPTAPLLWGLPVLGGHPPASRQVGRRQLGQSEGLLQRLHCPYRQRRRRYLSGCGATPLRQQAQAGR